MHVALVGSMGAGKTTIGTRLAERLGVAYLDNDDRLRALWGMGADEVEERHGLDALHAAEAEILLQMLEAAEPAVVAAAASTIEVDACRDALRTAAFTVWLRVPPEVTAAKVKGSGRPRGGEPEEALAALAQSREPAFAEAADLIVDRAAVADPGAAVEMILAALPPGVSPLRAAAGPRHPPRAARESAPGAPA
jgi:shikimate kinase